MENSHRRSAAKSQRDDLRDADLRDVDFLAVDFFAADFFVAAFFDGTFAPLARASLIPIAIACLRLVTLRPELDFSPPSLYSCITLCTLSSAFLEYLAMIKWV